MTLNEYSDQAILTESPINEERATRVVRTWEILKDIFEDEISQSKVLDKVKRYAYYLKDDEELIDQLMPTYPTGERRERIAQCARILHGLVGLMSEVGEFCEPLIEYIEEGGELDRDNLLEESSDFLWYVNLIIRSLGGTMNQVAVGNILKLRKRFKDKGVFTSYDALRERDKAAEMQGFGLKPSVETKE